MNSLGGINREGIKGRERGGSLLLGAGGGSPFLCIVSVKCIKTSPAALGMVGWGRRVPGEGHGPAFCLNQFSCLIFSFFCDEGYEKEYMHFAIYLII